MAQKRSANLASRSRTPRHGHVFSPESRAYFAWLEGKLDEGALNQIEAGKFFPEREAGLTDPVAPTDDRSNRPPEDGRIASGGWDYARFLDEPGTQWKKHDVLAGDVLTVSWDYSAQHLTRRWNYFLTRPDWNPELPLSRAQFEDRPFFKVELQQQPHWENHDALWPPKPSVHDLVLPKRTGYHALLAVWEVANTGNAFYQVIDLNFVGDGGGQERPNPPTGLHASEVASQVVGLSWNATTGPYPVVGYRVYRDGSPIAQLGETEYEDRSLTPDAEYRYFVTAIDNQGNESMPGQPISVRTPQAGGDTPPTAPSNLHAMAVTANSVHLMWGPSSGADRIAQYLIYREGVEVSRVPGTQLEYVDTGLTAYTSYRYFAAALDARDRLSVPSNILRVRTAEGAGGDAPEWKDNTAYEVEDRVRYQGSVYRCFQRHTSNPAWNPVETINVLWLLVP